MENDHPQSGGDRISLVASEALISALDAASGREGVSRAHLVRRIIAERMKIDGFLRPDAPTSRYEAKHRPSA